MRGLFALLALLPLALPACEEGGGASTSAGSGGGSGAAAPGVEQAPTSGGGVYLWGDEEQGIDPDELKSLIEGPRLKESLPSKAEPVAPEALPEVRYLENRRVRVEREVLFFEDNAVDTGFREVLWGDGEGRFRLEPVETLDDEDPLWDPAPLEAIAEYEARGAFLVRFRDPHLGHPRAYETNYNWYRDPTPRQVAGRDCTLWSARSRYAFGGLDLLLDDATGLLLGWTMYDPGLVRRASCQVVTLDLDPDLAGVDWHRRTVYAEDYDVDLHRQRVGIEPIVPAYLPPGFYQKEQQVLASGPLLGVPHDLHVRVYHDGVQPLFVVQQKVAGSSAVVDSPVTTVRHSRVAGVEMVEALVGGVEIWVCGTLPALELETIFASMLPS